MQETTYVSSECNNIYRQRHDSDMRTIIADGYYFSARHFFLRYLDNYLQERQIQDPAVHKLLRQAFFPYQYPMQYKATTIIRRCKQWIKLRVNQKSISRNEIA